MTYTCNECNNLELLPFLCHDCKKYFCRKHYAFEKHKCINTTNNNNNYRYVSESKLREVHLCHFTNCNNDENTSICENCDKKFCTKHKYPWHKCDKPNNVSLWDKLTSCFKGC